MPGDVVGVRIALGSTVAIYYILYGLRDRTEPEPQREAAREETTQWEDEPLALAPLPLVGELPPDHLHPNGSASSGNGHEPGPATVPLGSAHPTTNWLVWSTDEIASTDLPTTVLPVQDLQEEPEQAIGTSAIELEESVPPLVTRPLHSSVRVPVVDEESFSLDQPAELTPARAEDLLTLRWTGPRLAWAVIAGIFLFIGLIFPIWGTPDKVAERIQPDAPVGTLSGLAYMDTAVFSTDAAPFPIQMKYDLEGINWLNDNVKGLATIAEFPIGYYREGGMRVASNTGLPMVSGDLHETEQRAGVYDRLVGERRSDVRELYRTPDVQRALTIISKYDIDYIYLGQLEMGYLQKEALANNRLGQNRHS